jgi:hypothetical protein
MTRRLSHLIAAIAIAMMSLAPSAYAQVPEPREPTLSPATWMTNSGQADLGTGGDTTDGVRISGVRIS